MTVANQIAGETTGSQGEQFAAPQVLQLTHDFFKTVGNCYFRLTEDTEEPVLVVEMEDTSFSLPIPGIRREFNIEDDSPDGRMLDMVGESLNFVVAIRPGEEFPKEVVTGEASWEVTEAHRAIAYNRLTMQLVNWLSGGENLFTERDQLLQIAEDPKTKEKINVAFGEAANEIGYGADGKEKIVAMIEGLADELSHIEALRDRLNDIAMMEAKIQALRRLYGHELSILEVADSVSRLITLAGKSFGDAFDQLDAQTGEVVAVLKNIESQRQFIRDTRNDLFRRLRAWSDIIVSWQELKVVRSRVAEDLLRDTYRFLAPRFMKVDEWDLVTARYRQTSENKSEMRW